MCLLCRCGRCEQPCSAPTIPKEERILHAVFDDACIAALLPLLPAGAVAHASDKSEREHVGVVEFLHVEGRGTERTEQLRQTNLLMSAKHRLIEVVSTGIYLRHAEAFFELIQWQQFILVGAF